MKATGIVRRIDELGRVVIPKEIRRTQRIRRGDPLEIFTTGDGEVIFKKYSPVGELQGVAVQYAEVLSRSFALTAFVADRDRILAAAGSGRRDLADRSVSQPLEKVMESRKPYLSDGDPEHVLLPCEGSLRPLLCAWPIIAAGDVTGAVGLLAEDRTQRIRRGDPLEIFTTGEGEVIFKKYSPVGELHGVAVQYVEVLSRSFALTAFVADRDRILAAAGAGRRDLADRSVSQPLERVMESRKPYLSEGDPEHVLLPCEGSLR